MAATQVEVTAKLDTILNLQTDMGGSVSIQLCGYASQIPRVNGVAVLSAVEALNLSVNPQGIITVTLYGNDQISPAGTFYAFTFMDDNGDVIQTNAYRFTGGGSFDLSLIDPYDPNQPPPPLPPLITNLLLIAPWSADMEFPGDTYTSFRTTLEGDVTSSTAPGTVQGNLYTFIIQQDGIGGHAFTWPTNFINATPVNPDPNGFTVQTFVMGNIDLIAVGPGMWEG
jgi:hypothetical protein